MNSNSKKPFGLHGLYECMSARVSVGPASYKEYQHQANIESTFNLFMNEYCERCVEDVLLFEKITKASMPTGFNSFIFLSSPSLALYLGVGPPILGICQICA